MASIDINGASLGNSLTQLLTANEILPGDQPSYELCKQIWVNHPLGGKMVWAPVKLAQFQPRRITVGEMEFGERVAKQFEAEWKALGCNRAIGNAKATSRAYGVSTLGLRVKDQDPSSPVDWESLVERQIRFATYDPLNTSGSLVLNQDPDDFDFQMPTVVAVAGKPYHPSRTLVTMNGEPIYIAYSTSAFGYVGRSVFQSALYPLKSFINTMITDDMIARKAGLLVAKVEQQGSIVNRAMAAVQGFKREILKLGQTNNVLSISPTETIETLNMQNIDGAGGFARTNILKNVATAADMPARLLENETMVSGFGEGTEDANNLAAYIKGFREECDPLYEFCDRVTQYRAWTPEFYATLKSLYPKELAGVSYNRAFKTWQNSFSAVWPHPREEGEKEKSDAEKVRLEGLTSAVQVLIPILDPENKARAIGAYTDNLNSMKTVFSSPLDFDSDDFLDYQASLPPGGVAAEDGADTGEEPKAPKPLGVAA